MYRLLLFILLIIYSWEGVYSQNKPYISGTSLLKMYATNGSVGIAIEPKEAPEDDILNLKGGDFITVSVATLDSYYVLSGKLALAIIRGNDIVEILAKRTIPASISSISFQYFQCIINEDTEILPGDELRLLTTYDEILYCTVDAAYGQDVTDRIPATNYQLPLFNINYPEQVEGVLITPSPDQAWTNKAIKGRNFYLYIEKVNPEDVLVVRANGKAWVPESGVYMLTGVKQDYDVDIKVYKKEECNFYRVIATNDALRVEDILKPDELDYIKGLKVKGKIMNSDFLTFRDRMPSLEVLDLREACIENDYLPESAFELNNSITEVCLPEGLVGLSNNAFRYAKKLTHIVLPKSLNVFGYNAFFGCESLEKVWVKWNPVEAGVDPIIGFPIPPCAFRATPYKSRGLLIVPKGCLDAYEASSIWSDFYSIREEAPVDRILLEKSFSRFNPVDESDINNLTTDDVFIQGVEGGCIVDSRTKEIHKITIFDLNGRICSQLSIKDQRILVSLRPGLYIVGMPNKKCKVLVP